MSNSILTALSAFLTISAVTTVVRSTPASYIVGGSQAAVGDFPYFADMDGCGGTLIAPDAILFAAHCGDSAGKQIVVGAYEKGTLGYGAQARFCEEWVPHPQWDAIKVDNDFALCKLDEPVDVDESRVRLELNDDPAVPSAIDGELIVAGLGALAHNSSSPSFLHSVAVPVLSNDECDEMYDGAITDSMLCAGFEEGGKDSCQGDSGGPIVKRVAQDDGSFIDYHVGVVSFGYECARAGKPGVYARTSAAKDFIEETVCGGFRSVASFCADYDEDEHEHETEEEVEYDPVVPPASPCEAEIEIVVETDVYGSETNWSITEMGSETALLRRKYLVSNHRNDHRICVERSTCYSFNISDAFGDGLCADDDDHGCGFYELRVSGQMDAFSSGASFASHEVTTFCIDSAGNQVDELPLPTTAKEQEDESDDDEQPECKDNKDFRFRGNRSCGFVGRKRSGKTQRLCKKEVRGNKTIADHCPETCGKAGVGRCQHLDEGRKRKKNKKKKKKQNNDSNNKSESESANEDE